MAEPMSAELGGGAEPTVTEPTLQTVCNRLRVEIQGIALSTNLLLDHSDMKAEQEYAGQRSEMKANVMLAYRHLEDARMRVGKILQAADDGISILDKPKT